MEKSAVVARATSADFSMIRFSLYNCFYYDYSVEKCSGMTIIHRKTFRHNDYSIKKRKYS